MEDLMRKATPLPKKEMDIYKFRKLPGLTPLD